MSYSKRVIVSLEGDALFKMNLDNHLAAIDRNQKVANEIQILDRLLNKQAITTEEYITRMRKMLSK